jgi:hypothetical protein
MTSGYERLKDDNYTRITLLGLDQLFVEKSIGLAPAPQPTGESVEVGSAQVEDDAEVEDVFIAWPDGSEAVLQQPTALPELPSDTTDQTSFAPDLQMPAMEQSAEPIEVTVAAEPPVEPIEIAAAVNPFLERPVADSATPHRQYDHFGGQTAEYQPAMRAQYESEETTLRAHLQLLLEKLDNAHRELKESNHKVGYLQQKCNELHLALENFDELEKQAQRADMLAKENADLRGLLPAAEFRANRLSALERENSQLKRRMEDLKARVPAKPWWKQWNPSGRGR